MVGFVFKESVMVMRGRTAGKKRSVKNVGAAAVAPPPTATAPATGSWTTLGRDGRLTVYARCPGGLLRWTETTAGGPAWSSPEFFPVADLTHLTVVQGADTYVHFLGRRERHRGDGAVEVDVVHAIQYQSGRPVTEWRSLGNPHREPDRARRFGVPAGAVAADGTVHVLVRNAGGGLMLRREGKGGRWEPWADLRGTDVLDGLAVTGVSDGRIEVFAPAGGAALHWVQPEPGDELRRSHDVRPGPLAGSVAAVETAPGRLTWFWTDPAGSGLVCHRRGGWSVPLGGGPGGGANAVVRTLLDGYDCTVVVHRGANGRVLVGVCGTEAESQGLWWTDTGLDCAGDPALVHDGQGRLVIAAFDRAGSLRVARQVPGAGLVLGEWTRV